MKPQIREIVLTKAERKELRKRIRKTKDRKTSDRLRIVLFKAEGFTHHQIAELLQVSINTVTHYLQCYKDGGIDAV